MVSDHGSTDETWDVLTNLGVEKTLLPRHEGSDFQDNFKHVFSLPTTEWTWMFGDDDLLLPGALQTVLDTLNRFDGDFIKVAERVRASESPGLRRGTMLDLCNEFGWLEMTGFITGNIVRTEKLRAAVNLPSWGPYSKNAFPHSCALLEEMHDSKAIFIDYPLIDSQEKPENDHLRWEANQTATRFFYVDLALQDMVDRKVLKLPFDNVFFRYHSYFLWDRLISNMISDYSTFPDKPQIHLWKHIEGLANLLSNDQNAILKCRILEVQEVIEKHQLSLEELGKWSTGLKILNDQHNTERFGWTYRGEPKPPEFEETPPAGSNGFTLMIHSAQKRQRAFDIEVLDRVGFSDQAKTLKANRLADFA